MKKLKCIKSFNSFVWFIETKNKPIIVNIPARNKGECFSIIDYYLTPFRLLEKQKYVEVIE